MCAESCVLAVFSWLCRVVPCRCPGGERRARLLEQGRALQGRRVGPRSVLCTQSSGGKGRVQSHVCVPGPAVRGQRGGRPQRRRRGIARVLERGKGRGGREAGGSVSAARGPVPITSSAQQCPSQARQQTITPHRGFLSFYGLAFSPFLPLWTSMRQRGPSQ